MTGAASPWICPYVTDPRADRVRLICLPHAAGGGSAYRGWPASLPPGIGIHAVTLPGREDRILEWPLTDVRQVVDGLRGDTGSSPLALGYRDRRRQRRLAGPGRAGRFSFSAA